MALEVEDGTGKANANSFASIAELNVYHSDLGNTEWTGDDSAKEAAARRATAYVSTAFRYIGKRSQGRTQALAWPREGVLDSEGNEILNTELPQEIVDATCEAALYEIVNPNGLNLTITMTDRVKREKIDVIETEYADSPVSAEAARPVLSKLDNLLSAFILGDAGTDATNTTFLDRA